MGEFMMQTKISLCFTEHRSVLVSPIVMSEHQFQRIFHPQF